MWKIVDVRQDNRYQPYTRAKLLSPFVVINEVDGRIVDYLREKDRDYTASFETFDKANEFYQNSLLPKKGLVYVVLKNSDFTEGRGPMRFHKIFHNELDAHRYIMTQKGIYGSPQGYSQHFGTNVHGGAYVSLSYNGYDKLTAIIE